MRQTLISSLFIILLLLFVVFTLPVRGSETGTVTATVTPKQISIIISPTSIAYGTVELGQNDIPPTPDNAINVRNNGTVNEHIQIKGNDAVASSGGNTWILSNSSTGSNQYMHKFIKGSSSPTSMSTAYSTLVAMQGPGMSDDIKFRISMPTSSSGPAVQYNTTIDILATEAM